MLSGHSVVKWFGHATHLGIWSGSDTFLSGGDAGGLDFQHIRARLGFSWYNLTNRIAPGHEVITILLTPNLASRWPLEMGTESLYLIWAGKFLIFRLFLVWVFGKFLFVWISNNSRKKINDMVLIIKLIYSVNCPAKTFSTSESYKSLLYLLIKLLTI